MLNWGPHTSLTALQPDLLSSRGSTQSLPPMVAVAWMPWHKTGAPQTIGYVLWLVLLSIRVRHLMSCSGRGTLIIPEWPSAYFLAFLT